MWQPLSILNFAQTEFYSPAGRALTFFAGLAIWLHQLFVNVTQNNVGAGMDLAGIFPRYISTQRGAVLLIICGIVIQPWRFFTQASVFISVISSFGGSSSQPLSREHLLTQYCSFHIGGHSHHYSGLLGHPQEGVEGPGPVSRRCRKHLLVYAWY
jgi:hypothetical protein